MTPVTPLHRPDLQATSMQDTNREGTRLGPSMRGGWRPIQDEYSNKVDWVCPTCNLEIYSMITGSHQCGRCGLHVLENPEASKEYVQPDRAELLQGWYQFHKSIEKKAKNAEK